MPAALFDYELRPCSLASDGVHVTLFGLAYEEGEAICGSCYHARMPVRLKEGFAFSGEDVLASYEGAGSLTIENGARIACQFRADQDGSGMVQLLCHRILPNGFAFHLLALLDAGGSTGFRGTTAAGLTVVMDAERGGRPLSLDSDGYGSIYFLPGKIAVFDKEPPTNSHRYLLTNFAFSPFTHLGEPPHHPPPHRMALIIDGQSVDVEITPLPDYVQRVVSLWQTRAIAPTCELHIPTPCPLFREYRQVIASQVIDSREQVRRNRRTIIGCPWHRIKGGQSAYDIGASTAQGQRLRRPPRLGTLRSDPLVIAIITVIVGAVVVAVLPVAQFPAIAPPEVQISATYVGADAQTIEQSVATPVEQQMSGVDNMNYMYSLNATAVAFEVSAISSGNPLVLNVSRRSTVRSRM